MFGCSYIIQQLPSQVSDDRECCASDDLEATSVHAVHMWPCLAVHAILCCSMQTTVKFTLSAKQVFFFWFPDWFKLLVVPQYSQTSFSKCDSEIFPGKNWLKEQQTKVLKQKCVHTLPFTYPSHSGILNKSCPAITTILQLCFHN